MWIAGCKFPQAGPLALRKLSDFIRQSQCLRRMQLRPVGFELRTNLS